MFRAKLSFIALAVVFLCPSYRLFAFDDWQPINPEELKMTADPAHPGDAIILYHEETADDMTRHTYVYKRVKVFTEKGKNRANVEIPYDASIGGVADIKARTISPDGTITPFTGKAFNSTIVKSQGIKYLAKTFTLPNVQAGSIIEWKYTEYWEDFLFGGHWTIQDDLFQKRAKFSFVPFQKSGHYIQDERGDIKDRVLYTIIGLPENTAIKTVGSNDRMELELKDIPAFVEEDFSPPAAVLKMRVNFFYGTDKSLKPQDFWKNEGKYWSKEADKFMGHSGAVAAAATQLVSPTDTPEQKARKIYAYAQKIKNLSYDRDEGILEELRKDRDKRTAEDVVHRNAGFSNDVARLFVAMAHAVNLQAYLMRVADRERVFFQANIPNPLQLTREIAVVSLGDGKEIFLDPGTPLCPFGLLAWQHTSTQGLRQNPNGGAELAATPAANYKDAVSKRVARLILAEDGSAKGKVAIAWAGEEALVRRLSGLKTDEAGKKKELEDELKRMLPPGSLVKNELANGWDNSEAQLTATFSVEIPSLASNVGKRMLVPTNLFESQSRQPFSGGERKNPVYFYYPYYAIDETHITFPASMHMENMPETQPLRTDYSLYKVQRSTSGNTVTVNRDFGMAGIGFKPNEYPDLRKFYAAVSTGDSEPLVLTAAK
jgi:hypothetical protein